MYSCKIWDPEIMFFDSCLQNIILPATLAAVTFICFLKVLFAKNIRRRIYVTRLSDVPFLTGQGVLITVLLLGILIDVFTGKGQLDTYISSSLFIVSSICLAITQIGGVRRFTFNFKYIIFISTLYFIISLNPLATTFRLLSKNHPLTIWNCFSFVVSIICLFNAVASIWCKIRNFRNDTFSEPLNASNEQAEHNLAPEMGASIFSLVTFSWVSKLVADGYKKSIYFEDLPSLHPDEVANPLYEKLNQAWAAELSSKPHGKRSIVRVLAKMHWKIFLTSTVFKVFYDVLLFSGPFFLNKLVYLVENSNTSNSFSSSKYMGFIYSVLLMVTSFASTATLHQYFHRQMRLGIRIRSALTSMIYSKCLKIPFGMAGKINPDGTTSNTGTKSSGQIVNLIAVDSRKILELMTYIQVIWSGPFQIFLAMILLFNTLGISALGALLVSFLMIPLSGILSWLTKKNEHKLMKASDNRLKNLNESLGCIRVLKMMSWEDSFEEMIQKLRNIELSFLWNSQILYTLSRLQWNLAPVLVSLVALSLYVWLGNQLDAATAFTTISLVNILRFPMQIVPDMINGLMLALVSLKRIQDFLETPELNSLTIRPFTTIDEHQTEPILKLNNVSTSWFNGTPLLKNVNFNLRQGKLVAVLGSTGCGKSGFLYSIIGDTMIESGVLDLRGSISYSSQVAWVQNCSVRENICFKKTYYEDYYEKVVSACALKPDFAMLPAGDHTEIGERGINLSGGQKQRISIARCIYQEADIYVFDDCFSALDANVADHIFHSCMLDILSEKTVILVTHKLDLLPYFDQVIFIKDQTIIYNGDFSGLQEMDFYKEFSTSQISENNSAATETLNTTEIDSQSQNSVSSPDQENNIQSDSDRETVSRKSSPLIKSKKSTEKPPPGDSLNVSTTPEKGVKSSTIIDEKLLHGKVNRWIYWKYIKNCSVFMVVLFMLSLVLSNIMSALKLFWLTYWTDNNDIVSSMQGITMFSILSISQVAFAINNLIFLTVSSQNASQQFHLELLHGIMRAPVSFFDTTPLGRILNRFSTDTLEVDEILPNSLMSYFNSLLVLLVAIASIVVALPLFLLAILLLGSIYYYYQLYYIPTSRQLQRINSTHNSPVIAHFSETLDGTQIIRAFRFENLFRLSYEQLIDNSFKPYYMKVASNRWLAVRLESIGTGLVFFTSFLASMYSSTLGAGLAALAISYSLNITQSLTFLVRIAGNIESSIVSVERINEYSHQIPKEPEQPVLVKHTRNWPSKGDIKFENFSLRYRDGLPLVLRNINLHIHDKEKIGIVGRTGAGKSSLISAFLRLTEAASGNVFVDDHKIADINLKLLRTKFCLITQTPSLFVGTLRFNLDPLETATDYEIFQALEKAHIKDYIFSLQNDPLSYLVDEGGKNFSVGQRQLICLARALIHRSKIVLLDEATSVVDPQTDSLIQQTIREEFSESTILTIAHRIHTIVNSDRILVIENGQVHAFDTPEALFYQKGSIFREMCIQSGIIHLNGEFVFDNSSSPNLI